MNSRPILQPLALVGALFAFSLLAASFLSAPLLAAAVAVCILCCFLAIILFWLNKGSVRILAVLLTICTAIGISAADRYKTLNTAGFAGRQVAVEAMIRDAWQGNRAAYLLDVKAGDLPAGTKVVLYAGEAPEYGEGERVSVTLALANNPPTRSQLARGAELIGFAAGEDMRLLKEAALPYRISARLERMVRYSFARYFTADSAAFLTALFFGDRSELPTSLNTAFTTLGLSHILCISGLHIGILTKLVLLLFNRLLGKGKGSFLLCAAVTGAFLLFTGAGASAGRAWLMSIFSLSAFALCRDYSPGNALGGAMLLLCLANPRTALGTGFWLSVISCWALFSVAPFLSEALCWKLHIRNRIIRTAISGMMVTISVNICCLPAFFLWFGSIPWNCILPNLLLVPLMPVILAGSWLSLLPIPGRELLAGILDLILRGIFRILNGMAAFSGSLPLSVSFLPIWLIGSLLLFGLGFRRKNQSYHKLLAVSLSAVLLAAGCIGESLSQKDVLSLAVLESSGSGSLVLSWNGRALVIGCGGSEQIGRKTASFLRATGIRKLDTVILPKESRRLMGGVPELAREFPPAQIVGSEQSNWHQTLSDYSEAHLLPLTDGRYTLWGNASLEISHNREMPDIGFFQGDTQILFQSSKQPVPENDGWDLVIFYDEIPKKDGIPSDGCAIIEAMRFPFSADWLEGSPLFGEYFAPECRYFFNG